MAKENQSKEVTKAAARRPKRKSWWLFALPVMVVPLSLSLRSLAQPYPHVDADVSTFSSYSAGEKAAVSRLSQEVTAHPEAVNLAVHWSIGQNSGDPGNSYVGIIYSRRDHKLSAFDLKSGASSTKAVNVNDDVIHQVAARGGAVSDMASQTGDLTS